MLLTFTRSAATGLMRPGPKLASPCRQHDLLLALGSISPPEYTARRMAQRLTWMTSDDVGPSGSICAMFIMRTGMMPQPLMLAAERESAVYGDMLLANTIVWNETRVRGPTLSLGWWLSYASHELRHARFVGKIDDDTYLHIPDLSALLRHVHAGVSPSAYVYLGVLTYYHWYPRLFDKTMHAWGLNQAWNVGKWCRSNDLTLPAHLKACGPSGCGRCIGPFIFASGFLIVLSQPLLASVAFSPSLESEMQVIATDCH